MTWLDWLNVAATIATVGAAVLALLTIRDSRRQAQRSAANLVRERRIDYELGLLKELAEYCAWGSIRDDRTAQIRLRLVLLPGEDLPRIREHFAATGPLGDMAARIQDDALVRNAKAAGVDLVESRQRDWLADISAAIDARLTERAS
jgi:hypothetical protein